jgi:hypothetical protein
MIILEFASKGDHKNKLQLSLNCGKDKKPLMRIYWRVSVRKEKPKDGHGEGF